MAGPSTLLVALVGAVTALFPLTVPSPSQPNPMAHARHLVFDVTLAAFIGVADDPSHDPRLDWSSDGCSAPLVGDTGLSFDFRNPCRRHDFAYRNFTRLNGGLIWTPTMRRRVDEVFLRDMRQTCRPRPWMVAVRCLGWAETFYRSVRMFAGV